MVSIILQIDKQLYIGGAASVAPLLLYFGEKTWVEAWREKLLVATAIKYTNSVAFFATIWYTVFPHACNVS